MIQLINQIGRFASPAVQGRKNGGKEEGSAVNFLNSGFIIKYSFYYNYYTQPHYIFILNA